MATQPPAFSTGGRIFGALALSAIITTSAIAGPPRKLLTLEELIALPEERLAEVDIAAMNLAAAAGLPGLEGLDQAAMLDKLDAWAALMAYEIDRHMYRFRDHPEEYDHSLAEFCMLCLTNFMQQELGVKYNEEQAKDMEKFDFRKAEDLFLPGLLEGTGGTCASMPVLYVAVGRRLGYPLKLVQGIEHLYLRWDDPDGERFNIEGTSPGYNSYPDEHYVEWPRKMIDVERERGDYFRSMSPRQELSSFLTTRGGCLFAHGLLADSHWCYKKALDLWPRNVLALIWSNRTGQMLEQVHEADMVEAAYQRITQQQRNAPRIILPGEPTISLPSPFRPNVGARPRSGDFVLPRPQTGMPDVDHPLALWNPFVQPLPPIPASQSRYPTPADLRKQFDMWAPKPLPVVPATEAAASHRPPMTIQLDFNPSSMRLGSRPFTGVKGAVLRPDPTQSTGSGD